MPRGYKRKRMIEKKANDIKNSTQTFNHELRNKEKLHHERYVSQQRDEEDLYHPISHSFLRLEQMQS